MKCMCCLSCQEGKTFIVPLTSLLQVIILFEKSTFSHIKLFHGNKNNENFVTSTGYVNKGISRSNKI